MGMVSSFGLGGRLAFNFWETYTLDGEEYDRAFEKWRQKKGEKNKEKHSGI